MPIVVSLVLLKLWALFAPLQASPPVSSSTPPPSAFFHPPSPPPQQPFQIHLQGPFSISPDGVYHVSGGISISYLGTTISADRMDGSFKNGFLFSGNARIERNGISATADTIFFYPPDGSFRLGNPHGMLTPSLFNGNIYSPIFLKGQELEGNQSGYLFGQSLSATTCTLPTPHYQLQIGSAELIPYQKLTLRKVSIFFFGVKLLTLPELVIPLNQRLPKRPRTNYLPEFGQNIDEGYFARFPYAFAEGRDAAGLIRLDVTQKRGIGYRFEQEYLAGKQTTQTTPTNEAYSADNGVLVSAYGYGSIGNRLPRLGTGLGPTNGGLFSLQGYLSQGFNTNFSASFKHQQNIGSNNRIAIDSELQRNSYTFGTGTVSYDTQTTRFDFNHTDPLHGTDGDLTLNLATSFSPGFFSRQLTGSLKQDFLFGSSGSTHNSLSFDLELSDLLSGGSGLSSKSERLDENFSYQHDSREYALSLVANGSTPIGVQTGGTFGVLQKLPELKMDVNTYRFRGGWLQKLPATLELGVGQYSEPGSEVNTDRVLLGLNTQPITLLTGRTELTTALGFEQRFYGDGAAQYRLHDDMHLRQHIAGRSGFDIDYVYDQPEGATPFYFDQLRRSHYLSFDGGYLDDPHFQFTARVGYDLTHSPGTLPWQSLSTRLMWRPTPSVRFDATQVYDPNRGRFFALVNQLSLRGKNDFGLDILANIDPQQPGIRRKITQLNTQFSIPIGRAWRINGLYLYNGLTGSFTAQNLQIIHDWDCLEMSLTYTNNVGGFRPERAFYLSIRITAFPFFRAFGYGPAGQALGTGIGSLY
ncbi:hypothetical protein CTKA_00485 [Chthonomonas calidirosea]|uniref:Organic solvent tolerance protein OstA n=1 Tax=Chthonomonas calidirosea (strain DSM 23976 / ICMP 18418 / T49) TaxID=1303518 RepID=S0ETK4_CHTCT|nr:hypothetical protein [Chthonomonas calidirosea]CCW34495.1 hypothetical protein CCALI_00670 [Chthonomonas calidirosea T49]CEK14619.1 hypothetical protein CTKA_00485 [Chthonomonas calidirosea]